MPQRIVFSFYHWVSSSSSTAQWSIKNNIKVEGDIKNLMDEVDVIVDCTPKKIGKENKEKYYLPNKIKAIFF